MSENRIIGREHNAIERRSFGAQDLVSLAMIGAGTPLAVLLPPEASVSLCRTAAAVLPQRFYSLSAPDQVAMALEISDTAAARVMQETLAARLISTLAFLRARHLGPQFDITLEGSEHISASLRRGRGAVLWVADLVYANDISKIALFQHGHLVSHLSRPEHGFSDTRFGLKYLNPLRQNFELRYLRERIVHYRERPREAVDLMGQRLRENRLVSILACAYEGKALIEADFLGGKLRIAGGAPRLAFKQDSVVLPVFVSPAPAPPAFKVTVGAPLAMTHANKDAAILEATADFLQRLEPLVRARPELWRAWPFFGTRDGAPSQLEISPSKPTAIIGTEALS